MALTTQAKTIVGGVVLLTVVATLLALALLSSAVACGDYDMPVEIRRDGVMVTPEEIVSVTYCVVGNAEAARGLMDWMAEERDTALLDQEAEESEGKYIIKVPVSYSGPSVFPRSWHRCWRGEYVIIEVRLANGGGLSAFLRTTEPPDGTREAPALIVETWTKEAQHEDGVGR